MGSTSWGWVSPLVTLKNGVIKTFKIKIKFIFLPKVASHPSLSAHSFVTHIDWSVAGSFLRVNTSDYEIFCSMTKHNDYLKKEKEFKSIAPEWATDNWQVFY